jgi:hypothetical protein
MSEEVKQIEQEYHYQVDQQVSVNAFLDTEIDGETVRFQITSRYGSTPEKIVKTTKANIEAFRALRQEFPRQFAPVAQPEPVRVPVSDSGNELPEVNTFVAEKLDVSLHNGKYYFKVIGGKFTKYGVTVWDEVLKAAGLQIDMSNPTNLPNIEGWRADYITKEKDGKTVPDKVTRLLPGKAPF